LNGRLTIFAGAAMAVCALMVGCGGSDDSSPLSRAAFIEEAGDACKAERQGLTQRWSSYLENPSVRQVPEDVLWAKVYRTLFLPVVENEIAAIRRLDPPPGDEAKIKAILAAEQAGVEEVKRKTKAKSIENFGNYFAAANKKLRAYGLRACVKY
jgi:hypothetical protein